MPVAYGTQIEVEMFNGVRRTIAAGTTTHDPDGNPIAAELSAGWSAWVFSDGGPMGPKFKFYRVIEEREFPRWFANPERIKSDFQSIEFSAQERVKRNPELTFSQAIMSVIADCLMINENPGHKPTGVFLDWNWFRLDAYKAARGIGPVGVPGEFFLRKPPPKLAKAA